ACLSILVHAGRGDRLRFGSGFASQGLFPTLLRTVPPESTPRSQKFSDHLGRGHSLSHPPRPVWVVVTARRSPAGVSEGSPGPCPPRAAWWATEPRSAPRTATGPGGDSTPGATAAGTVLPCRARTDQALGPTSSPSPRRRD